jgi:hypothetical protein
MLSVKAIGSWLGLLGNTANKSAAARTSMVWPPAVPLGLKPKPREPLPT